MQRQHGSHPSALSSLCLLFRPALIQSPSGVYPVQEAQRSSTDEVTAQRSVVAGRRRTSLGVSGGRWAPREGLDPRQGQGRNYSRNGATVQHAGVM